MHNSIRFVDYIVQTIHVSCALKYQTKAIVLPLNLCLNTFWTGCLYLIGYLQAEGQPINYNQGEAVTFDGTCSKMH